MTDVVQTPMDFDLEEMINALEQMENHVSETIDTKTKSMNRRRALIVGAYRAAAEYSSGIRIMLTSKPMAKVASVLLRPLFEVWGTLEYVTLREDDLYLLEEMQESLRGQEKSQVHLEKYFEQNEMTKIGSLEINKIRSNQAKSRKSQDLVQKEIDAIEPDATKIDYTPYFDKQLQRVDEVHPPEKPEYAVYYNKLILYPHLSAGVHLGIDGISEWLDIDGRTIHYNRSGETPQDVKRVLWTAMALLKDISTIAMRELEAEDPEYEEKYQSLIDKHRK